jgi:hypothetical protein
MGLTKQIPRAEWKAYFARYSRERLELQSDIEGGLHPSAVVEIMSPDMGDQIEATLIPLLGMTYDPKSNAFELALEGVDHLAFQPTEIAVIEEDDGFVSAVEILRADGIKEIISLRRNGAAAAGYALPLEPQR